MAEKTGKKCNCCETKEAQELCRGECVCHHGGKKNKKNDSKCKKCSRYYPKDTKHTCKKEDLGGRPTKFKAEFVEKIIKFFDIDPYKKEVLEYSKEYFATGVLKKESEKFKHIPNKLPTLYGFAKDVGVDYTTVYRWAEKGEDLPEDGIKKDEDKKNFKRFCNAYKEAKELQKEFLISIGLAGAAPSPFAIFTAKNVTDMRDKQEVEHSGGIGLTDLFNAAKEKKKK